MRATVSRHTLVIRAHRLALAGMTGIWLWGGMLETGPALAGEPVGASPRPAHAQTVGPAPIPTARRTHESYVFFLGDGRRTHPPVTGRVQAAARSDQSSHAYLFFAPGKSRAARTPAPAVRPTSPTPVATPVPKSAVVGVEVAEEGLPLPPNQRGLIFFTPNVSAVKPGHAPVTSLAARSDLRKPTALAAIERVPVSLPKPPAGRPQPYLIFQPKPVRDRPLSSPKVKGTSSSATPPPASNAIVASHSPRPTGPARSRLRADTKSPRSMASSRAGPPTRPGRLETKPVPMPINRLEALALGREPSIVPANRRLFPSVPAPLPIEKTGRATRGSPVRQDRTPSQVARDPSAGIVGNRQPVPNP